MPMRFTKLRLGRNVLREGNHMNRERTVGRYDCERGPWEPVENIREQHEDAEELGKVKDTAYLMAAHYCSLTKICELCPVASECMHPDNIERPAALLVRHFYQLAEGKAAYEVPSWI